MDKQALLGSINNFFDVIHAEEDIERIGLLICALDLLAVQCHQVEYIFDETDYPNPSKKTM